MVQSSNEAVESLAIKLGKTPEVIRDLGIIDPHQFPKGYPGQDFVEETSPSASEDIRSASDAMYVRYRMAFPMGSSEIITPGTRGYSGDLSYEAIQLGFGEKASAVAAVIENPIAKGYRAPKDIYDFVTLYSAQKASAMSQGIPESRFKASDIAMKSFMEREFKLGTVKGQASAESAPTVTMRVQDIYRGFLAQTKNIATPAEFNIVAAEAPSPAISHYPIIGLPITLYRQTKSVQQESFKLTSDQPLSWGDSPTNISAKSSSYIPGNLISWGALSSESPHAKSSITFSISSPSVLESEPSPIPAVGYTSILGSASNSISPQTGIMPSTPQAYLQLQSSITVFPSASIPAISSPALTPSLSPPSITPRSPSTTIYPQISPPSTPTLPKFADLPTGPGGGFQQKRLRHFLETFRMGLDISSRGTMNLPKGMTMPKGLKLPKAPKLRRRR